MYTFTCAADDGWSWSRHWNLILLVPGSARRGPHSLTVSFVLIHGHPANTTEAALTVFCLESGGHRKLQQMVLLGGKIQVGFSTVLPTQGSDAAFTDNCWHQGQIIWPMVVLPDQVEDVIMDVDQIFLLPKTNSAELTHPILVGSPLLRHNLKLSVKQIFNILTTVTFWHTFVQLQLFHLLTII